MHFYFHGVSSVCKASLCSQDAFLVPLHFKMSFWRRSH